MIVSLRGVRVVLFNIMNFKLIKISEIDSIPDSVMGIYSWHLLPKRLTIEKLIRLNDSFSKFHVTLNGASTLNKFSEVFTADFRKLESSLDIIDFSESEFNLIKSVFSHITIPLYIGRTKNLKNRLNQHWKNYINARSDLREMYSLDVSQPLDSDEESSYFGLRLAHFNSDNWFGESELFIKIFEKESVFEHETIKRVEYYLNRFYKPILGLI